MAISINHATKVIYIPKNYLTYITGNLYELNVNQLRLDLKNLEDDEAGMVLVDTHRHNSEVTISGVTYARTLEIINNYTVTFEDGQYNVRCVGANHNLADVKNLNQVSLIVGNAAGLIIAEGALTTEEHDKLFDTNTRIKIIEQINSGCWKMMNNQLIIYEDDNVKEMFRFNLYDKDGQPSMTKVTHKSRVL